MFKNDRTYFLNDLDNESARELLSKFKRSTDSEKRGCYQEICDALFMRVNEKYFKPIMIFNDNTKMNENRESFGFIIMSVNCILIEFLYELINGIDQSCGISRKKGKVSDAYVEVLKLLDNEIIDSVAQKFYKGIRCGIIHQAQTKENTVISYGLDKIIVENGNYFLCNPETLLFQLDKYYKRFWKEARSHSPSHDVAQKILKKYKLILSHITR